MSGESLKVSIWRGNKISGALQDFMVPSLDNQTILDVVTYIQQNIDPTLSYRYACRVGMCGSCAMMVNGTPRWTCRTHVSKVIGDNHEMTLEPLRNLPVIKDLATDMDAFFDKWVKAEGVHHPTKTRHDTIETLDTNTLARVEANKAIECINCAVCYAACDVVATNPEYLGPAALNRAWSLVNDEKDGARDKILQAVSQAGGCHNCHSHQSCMQFCPNDLNPTASIAGLKRETTKKIFRLATFGGNR